MFCPNCGANNSTEQKFCRSCGLNLEKSAHSLLEQLPAAESANLLKQSKMLEKFGNFAFGGFGAVFLIGILVMIYVILDKMVLSGEKVLFGILLTLFIIFAALCLAYVVFNEILKEKKEKINPALNKELEKKDTARLLEDKPFEPVSSVVEDTTELLPVKTKTQKIK